MLSYYVQLREHTRSSINCAAKPEHEAHPQQNRNNLISEVTPPIAQEDTAPAKVVHLDEALEAMTEELKFDWPDFFDWKPVVTFKEVGLVVFLFVALIGIAVLCWDGFGYMLNAISFLALK
jgi:hypothetical protein